jgi:hypothetical protein
MHWEPTSTGARSREFGKQTSVGRIEACLTRDALQSAAWNQVPSRKETVTPWGAILTTGDGREKAKTVRSARAILLRGLRRGLIRGLRSLRRPKIRCQAPWASRPLFSNRYGGTEGSRSLGGIRSACREARAGRQLIGPYGADSAVPGGDTRGVRSRSVRGQGSNSRRKPATGVRIRGAVVRPLTQQRTSPEQDASRSSDASRRTSAEAGVSE